MVVAGRGLSPLLRVLTPRQGLLNPTSSGSYCSEGWQGVCWKEAIAQVASFGTRSMVLLGGRGVGKQFLAFSLSSCCWLLRPWANSLTSCSGSLCCQYPVLPKWKGFCSLHKQTWSWPGHQESRLSLPIMLLGQGWWSWWPYCCGSPLRAVRGDPWLSGVVLRLLTFVGYCLGTRHFAAVGVWPGQCVFLHTHFEGYWDVAIPQTSPFATAELQEAARCPFVCLTWVILTHQCCTISCDTVLCSHLCSFQVVLAAPPNSPLQVSLRCTVRHQKSSNSAQQGCGDHPQTDLWPPAPCFLWGKGEPR